MKYFSRFLIFSTFLIFAAACSSLAGDITPPPGYQYVPPPPTQDVTYYPSVAPDPVKGQAIYTEKCQPCHGDQGLGNGPDANGLPNPVSPIGTAELARDAKPSDWYKVVAEGRIDRYMPPFQSLTERQRWDAIAYAFSLSTSPEIVTQGQKLFQANCSTCHGDTGLGDGSDAVNFTDGVPSLADQMTMAKLSKTELFDAMAHPDNSNVPDVVSGLSEDDRWAITDYLRSMSFAKPQEETAATNPLETVTASEEATPVVSEPTAIPAEGEGQVAENTVVGTGAGVITGQVSNASGGEVPSDLEVVLHAFDQFQEVMSTTAKIATDGTFRFDGVEITDGQAYIVTTDYKGTTYTSDLAVADPATLAYDMPVSIYETSSEKSVLEINRLHVLFEFVSADQIRVAELILVSNLSDSVVVPTEDQTPILNFTLPEGATNLQFQQGALGRDFIQTSTGFGDLRAIIPGEASHQVLFSFDLPYDNGVEISQPMDLPVQSMVVLSPDVGVTVSGSGLTDGGVQDVQGTAYQVLSGNGIQEGGILSISLSGKPDLSSSSAAVVTPTSSTNLAVGLGVLGVSLLFVGVWLFRRSSKRVTRADEDDEDDDEEDEEASDTSAMDADSLMDAIIALDDHYKTGDLPEEAYLRRRDVLKEQLKKQMGQ